jgi:hypothetical protein
VVIELDEFSMKADGSLTKDITQLAEEDQANALRVVRMAGIPVCDQAESRHPEPQLSAEESAAEAERLAKEAGKDHLPAR